MVRRRGKRKQEKPGQGSLPWGVRGGVASSVSLLASPRPLREALLPLSARSFPRQISPRGEIYHLLFELACLIDQTWRNIPIYIIISTSCTDSLVSSPVRLVPMAPPQETGTNAFNLNGLACSVPSLGENSSYLHKEQIGAVHIAGRTQFVIHSGPRNGSMYYYIILTTQSSDGRLPGGR